MSETKNILEVKDLRVSYHTYAGEVQSVRGVSFELETGKALAIVGESGCGKSVTAKSIMGLIKGPAGEIKEGSTILYNGDNILNYSKKQWQAYKGGECAIIFQEDVYKRQNQVELSFFQHIKGLVGGDDL